MEARNILREARLNAKIDASLQRIKEAEDLISCEMSKIDRLMQLDPEQRFESTEDILGHKILAKPHQNSLYKKIEEARRKMEAQQPPLAGEQSPPPTSNLPIFPADVDYEERFQSTEDIVGKTINAFADDTVLRTHMMKARAAQMPPPPPPSSPIRLAKNTIEDEADLEKSVLDEL